jgi:hypothetical protein
MFVVSSRVATMALYITAVVNLLAGSAALALPDLNTTLLYGFEEPLEGVFLRYHYMIWSMVLAMGAGYWVAARAPERYSALILAAALGKLSIAGIWLEMAWHGIGTWLLLAGGVFDGTLGLLLLLFFSATRSR